MLPLWLWFTRDNVESVKEKADDVIHGSGGNFTLVFWAGLILAAVLVYKLIIK